MQSLDSSKSFSIGNVCIRDSANIVKIVTNYESLNIDNNTVWGTISRVTSKTGIGGSIVGNLNGYGCRFEISGSSFNLGTILNPTSLKIFSKSKLKHHAVFSKDTGGLLLGEGKETGEDGNVLETWGGIHHWEGIVRFRDTVSFLPSSTPETSSGANVKILTDVMFYPGSSLSFSTSEVDETTVFDPAVTPSLVLKGPQSIDLGQDPENIASNKIELILPGSMPEPGSFLTFKNKEENLTWSNGLFSKLALASTGLESLSTSQLIGLVMLLKTEVEKLAGKTLEIPEDYEQQLKDGETIYPPGEEPSILPAMISSVSVLPISGSAVQVGDKIELAVHFSDVTGISSLGPDIALTPSANLLGDIIVGGKLGMPKWDPYSKTYNFTYEVTAAGNAVIEVEPFGETVGDAVSVTFNAT